MYPDTVPLYIFAGFLGLIFGSFLNVAMGRIANKQSIIKPPSHCPNCRTFLKPLDLIPVISYLTLKGRCRYCGTKISPRYLAVELLTALIFIYSFQYYLVTPSLFKNLIVFSILLVMAGIDLEKRIIPNSLVAVLALWSLAWQLLYPQDQWSSMLLGMAAGGAIFLLIFLVSRGGMGIGDIKLISVLGFLAGWPGIIMVILLAFCLGAVSGIVLLALKKAGRKTALPFGPFIALGYFIYNFWGADIWNWYISLI